MSAASVPAPPGYTRLIFDDAFTGSTLNGAHWNSYITSRGANGAPWHSNGRGGSGEGRTYDAGYYQPNDVSVSNGLTITAHRHSGQRGFTWAGGVISTYGHFEFTGGYVQIRAQMPTGSGMWSGLWMLPGPAGTSGDDNEIDIFESGETGNWVSPYENYAWHLEGPWGKFGSVTSMGPSMLSGYHTYGLAWQPGQSITWYFDGSVVGQLTSAQTPIPNEPMELIVSQGIANHHASSWHASVGPRTRSPESMQVAEVQVWQ